MIASMQVEMGSLKADVDHLRYINISILWGKVPLCDVYILVPSTIRCSDPSYNVHQNDETKRVVDANVNNVYMEDERVDKDFTQEL